MTRARIKEAAVARFAEQGYEGTPLSEIAKLVGIKTPSIYAHYASKEDLLVEIWSDLVDDYVEKMEQILEEIRELPLKAFLNGMMQAYGNYFQERPVLYQLWARLLMFPPPALRDRVIADTFAVEEKILGQITEHLEHGIQSGELKKAPVEDHLAAYTIAKEGYCSWLIFYQPEDVKPMTERVWDLFWTGISGE
ncbi:MAG: TetR/AcrR family transcriptional regulator [Solirubrobacterales bacterium]